MRRIGSMIGLQPGAVQRYRELHAAVWPEVLARIEASNICNYSIFLKEPENVMFSYFEYIGLDFEADMQAIAADPRTREWWAVCGPLQAPLATRRKGEWWASMEEVFHAD